MFFLKSQRNIIKGTLSPNKIRFKVPNLRFPGFTDEWETKKLGDLCKIYDGTHQTPNYVESGIPFYSVEHITSNNFDKTKYISEEVYEKEIKRVKIEGDDILMTRIGDIGTSKYIDWNVKASFYVSLALIKQSSSINSKYLNQFISTNFFQKELWHRTIHVAFPKKINLGEIDNCIVNYPSNSEQKKISDFLSLLDERISTQNKIIEQLETLIKGLSEKIFSQKIRFKEFTDEWKVKSLGEMGNTFNGLSGKTKEDFGKGIPYIQYKQIFDSAKVQIKKCGLVEIAQNENQNSVKYGDIFFTISSETPDEIGMSSVLLDEVNEMYLNSFCFGYRPFSLQVLNPLFASYLFRSSVFRNEIVKLAQGSTRYNMSKIGLMKLTISLPSSKEQITIARFLSRIDQKLQTEKNILDKYQSKKQFLLQNLFI